MNFRLLGSILMAACLIVTLPACVYRMDIPQGNRIAPELLEELEIGMTRNQVRFLLGTPAILDPYRPDQWYYVYFDKNGETQDVVERHMTLSFTGDQLVSIEGSLNPD